MFNNPDFIMENAPITINSFYKAIHDLKINDISLEKIEEIKSVSKELNTYYSMNYDGNNKSYKYIKILEKIKTTPKRFNVCNSTEKLLLLMFIIDPNFEAVLIYEEENNIKDIKFRTEQKFGIYDPNIIKIEKWYIKNLLDKENKIKIEQEIERRAFK